jgi:hypothetical protein
MPPSNNNDYASFLSSEASSNNDEAPQQSQSPEYNEEEDNNDAGSQITLDMFDLAKTDFLTSGGLNAFSVALLSKAKRILLMNLPKTINPSGISKKNFRVTVVTLNGHIETLHNLVLSDNATARSIHDAVCPTSVDPIIDLLSLIVSRTFQLISINLIVSVDINYYD